MKPLKSLPPVRYFLGKRYERYFRAKTNASIFRGVYPSFAAAARTVPHTKPVGYDNEEPASMYFDRLERLYTSDYPLVFWLSRVLRDRTRVFDFGGHIGITYYAYKKVMELPKTVKWTVCDVPAVVEKGRKVAVERRAPQLDFITDLKQAEAPDVLITSGALQYVSKTTIGDLIDAMPIKPKHILINKAPLHDKLEFSTVQNFGTAFSPYRVFRRDRFIESVLARGYELVDSWSTTETCEIPYFKDHNVPAYSGLYFMLKDSRNLVCTSLF